MDLYPSAVVEILGRYWPKATYTDAQAAAIAREFRGLDTDQADAVAQAAFREQRSGRREPNVRLLGDHAARARRDESVRRATAVAGSQPGGATEWQVSAWARMRRCEWDSMRRDDYRGFFVWLFSTQYANAREVYVEGAFKQPADEHAVWWWKIHGQEVSYNLAHACGDDPRRIDTALADILGNEYAAVAEWREGAPQRRKEYEAKERKERKAAKAEWTAKYGDSGRIIRATNERP